MIIYSSMLAKSEYFTSHASASGISFERFSHSIFPKWARR